jgi:hypothetical protein
MEAGSDWDGEISKTRSLAGSCHHVEKQMFLTFGSSIHSNLPLYNFTVVQYYI